MVNGKINLLGLDVEALIAQCDEWGQKPFRALQLAQWIHQRGCADFGQMTNLAKSLRARLEETACVVAPPVIADRIASDGTRKWLFDVGDGNAVETVFIPETGRGTLCVSSQAGCAVKCTFCSTGRQGFARNLRVDEIIGQLWYANHALGQYERVGTCSTDRAITNVVFMGMGEPLQNYAATLSALRLMIDDHAYGLSRRRVTVSTSGVVPMIDRLREDCPVSLAISLHAPDDQLRDQLVPLNRKYPLAELLAACRRYLSEAPRDFVTFEYVMLDGINDSDEQARALLQMVGDLPCKFNLIPFNPVPGSGLRKSTPARVQSFAQVLGDEGIITTVRKTRGDDIDAACGQLAGEVRDRTRAIPIKESVR